MDEGKKRRPNLEQDEESTIPFASRVPLKGSFWESGGERKKDIEERADPEVVWPFLKFQRG